MYLFTTSFYMAMYVINTVTGEMAISPSDSQLANDENNKNGSNTLSHQNGMESQDGGNDSSSSSSSMLHSVNPSGKVSKVTSGRSKKANKHKSKHK